MEGSGLLLKRVALGRAFEEILEEEEGMEEEEGEVCDGEQATAALPRSSTGRRHTDRSSERAPAENSRDPAGEIAGASGSPRDGMDTDGGHGGRVAVHAEPGDFMEVEAGGMVCGEVAAAARGTGRGPSGRELPGGAVEGKSLGWLPPRRELPGGAAESGDETRKQQRVRDDGALAVGCGGDTAAAGHGTNPGRFSRSSAPAFLYRVECWGPFFTSGDFFPSLLIGPDVYRLCWDCLSATLSLPRLLVHFPKGRDQYRFCLTASLRQ